MKATLREDDYDVILNRFIQLLLTDRQDLTAARYLLDLWETKQIGAETAYMLFRTAVQRIYFQDEA